MKTTILVLGLFAQSAFASVECTRPSDRVTETFGVEQLHDCSDLKADTLCYYTEGHDAFTAYAFDKANVAKMKSGDTVAGYYLEGVVFTQWLVTSEVQITCRAL